ncbi:cytochrome c [Dyella sp. C9]|uniref:cytochrome c n=1 Tax=Dyella sp. C9 TaxID=2202154 RepID=UPI000DEEF6FF|nr:cytochrome c [Dyella sp. C9]
MLPLFRRLCLLALCVALPLHAAELTVDLGHGTHTYSTGELLGRHDVRGIDVPEDVAYKHPMRYRAVPLKALLAGASPDDSLLFVASDGFAVEIPASLVLQAHGSQAWLAIEDPVHAWPALAADKPSAGPFYLVWTDPQAMKIGQEQWPFQLAAIRRLAPVAERFPAIRPAASLKPDSPVRRGFDVFQRTCFACHTLNGEGDARLGPDLNIPHNPTEYLREDLLRAYIRDPQSLRRWPQARMPGFDHQALSDADLDDLLAYLHHMAGRKAQP